MEVLIADTIVKDNIIKSLMMTMFTRIQWVLSLEDLVVLEFLRDHLDLHLCIAQVLVEHPVRGDNKEMKLMKKVRLVSKDKDIVDTRPSKKNLNQGNLASF